MPAGGRWRSRASVWALRRVDGGLQPNLRDHLPEGKLKHRARQPDVEPDEAGPQINWQEDQTGGALARVQRVAPKRLIGPDLPPHPVARLGAVVGRGVALHRIESDRRAHPRAVAVAAD